MILASCRPRSGSSTPRRSARTGSASSSTSSRDRREVEIEDYLVATGPGESIELRNPMVVAPGCCRPATTDPARANRTRARAREGEAARGGRRGGARHDGLRLRDARTPAPSASCRRRTTPSRPCRRSCCRSASSPAPTPSPSRSASPSTVAGTGGSSASPNGRGSCAAATCSSRTSTTSTRCTRASSFEPSPTRSPAATYWFNQHVIDGIVNGVGHNTKKTGEWVYKNIDQRIVDGAVNASGAGRLRDRPRAATHPVRQGQPIRRAAVRRRRRRCHRPRHRQRELKVLLKIHANTH